MEEEKKRKEIGGGGAVAVVASGTEVRPGAGLPIGAVTGTGTGTGTGDPTRIGHVQDERISRLIWLGYLAGSKVASEGARKNVVEAVVDLVGRPVGTFNTVEAIVP